MECKRVYMISCEFDMNFEQCYSTYEKARFAIESAEWGDLCDMTLEEVVSEGLVSIVEREVE